MARHRHIVAWLGEVADNLRSLYQNIHAHPGPDFEERRTTALVAKCLRGWGYGVHEGIGRTGVIGVLRQGDGTRRLGLRADMDALPIVEATGLGCNSCHGGRMRACDHDGHTATLLGATHYLAATRRFDGTLILIFQPAEEGQDGAEAMLTDGLLERFSCDALFGIHNMPGLEAGHLGFRTGPMMTSQDLLSVTLEGVGDHGSISHLSVDPLLAASNTAIVLQSVMARSVDPQEAAVVTVGTLQAGEATDVMPQRAVLRLSLQVLDGQVREQVLQRIHQIIKLQATSYGCQTSTEHYPAYPMLINNVKETESARQVGVELTGAEQVGGAASKLMDSENFAWMLQRCPGSYLFIGNGRGRPMVHNSAYDFNDDIPIRGAAYWGALIET